MRRAINILQTASTSNPITKSVIYSITSKMEPALVRQMVEHALAGKFKEARSQLLSLLYEKGIAGEDIIKDIHDQIFNLNIDAKQKLTIIEKVGEYEFRHYASPRQAKRGELGRDVDIALDGPLGQRVFRIAAQTGLPVQLHYEVEDGLMAALEHMLAHYPQAKVIWCHLAQVRYAERAPGYTAAFVAALIGRFPNLYFDTAFGDATSIYPLSNQRHARVWAADGNLTNDWRDLIVAYPTRFLSALDLGGDRLHRIAEHDFKHRDFLKRLPATTQHRVAYRNAWSLLFGAEFDAA